MKTGVKRLVIVATAIILGIISCYFFVGWYNVIPWAIAALIIGLTSKNRRDSLINGAIFGYILFLLYIFIGYKGKTDVSVVFHFILFDILFSFLGAVAGAVGALLGNLLRRQPVKK
ncbi:MAG TPA: hypothetical protein VGI43_14500 [Mucilaginibacter sp.]|jgi:uncharacterized protein YqhQ